MLTEGDKVPADVLRRRFDSDAGEVTLASLAPAGKTLVLFFYPKDSTPGCTREAQAFSAQRRAIETAGGVVVGVSRDSVKSHCAFRDKFGLTVPLVSDPDRVLHEAFGAWGEKTMYGKKVLGAIRSTFLVQNGKVTRAWPSVKVDGHADQVLAALGGAATPAKSSAATKATTGKAPKPAAKKTTKAATAKATKPAAKKTTKATKPATKKTGKARA